MTDDEIDAHLDAVLRASGSALKHYSMHSTRQAMRAAMRAAVAAPQPSAKVNAMTEITRFSLDMDGSMDPDENGRWVFYDDFVTLTSEHASSERSHAAAIHGLRAAVDGLMAANAEIQGLRAKLEQAERAVVEKLAAMGGELPPSTKHVTSWDGDSCNWVPIYAYTAGQLRTERAKGVAAGMAQDRRWIPVAERLPTPDDEEVQVASSGGVTVGRYDGEWRTANYTYAITGVTHWQPLAPAPDQGQTP